MASVIDLKTQQEQKAAQNAQATQTAQNQAAAQAPAAANTAPAAPAAPSTSLKGLSENTTNKLNQYSQGYQQSASVQAAQNYLNGLLNSKPVADAQLSSLYDRIMNREQFTYDMNADALYQQYKDRYQSMGRQAMMDTMGNATALTGGYGSSYATTAGNQAYQQYLQQLNDIVPDLHNAALNRYTQQGADMMNQYNLAYGKHRDAVGDWQAERDFANSDYWNKYNADYSDYQNMLNYWNQMAQMENNAYYTDRDYYYNLAMSLIGQRKMPSEEMLAAAGLTVADATMLMPPAPSSRSSSRRSSGGGGSSGGDSGDDKVTPIKAAGNVIDQTTGPNSWSHFYYKK